jgi:hypothetical protein
MIMLMIVILMIPLLKEEQIKIMKVSKEEKILLMNLLKLKLILVNQVSKLTNQVNQVVDSI